VVGEVDEACGLETGEDCLGGCLTLRWRAVLEEGEVYKLWMLSILDFKGVWG
jgi:hypothetical protein